MSMKLYEIAQEYEAFLAAVENGDIPEEAISDTLEAIKGTLEDKADNVACVIKNLLAEIEAMKVEEDRLKERREQKERRAKSMKAYLTDTLLHAGINKIESARNKITFRKSESVVIDDESAFVACAPSSLLTYKDPSPNRTAIKEALKNGEEVFHVHIETKQNIQIK